MNPVEELKKEHQAVKLTLKVLDRICQRSGEAGEISNPDHLDQLIEFFKTFVDKCHHGKEEELLFPAMEKIGISNKGGPIGVMLEEHQSGREFIQGMELSLSQYKAGRPNATTAFIEYAQNYIALLNQHIDKEDNVLFSLAEEQLSTETKSELAEGFERIEIEKIGVGKHEEFHQQLEELNRIYLLN